MRRGDSILQFLRLDAGRLSGWYMALIFALVVSLFLSRFGLTVSIIFLVASVMLATASAGRLNSVPGLWLALPALVAVWYFASAGWSENVWDGFRASKVKWLFVILPFALVSIRGATRQQISAVYHVFIGLTVVGALWSLLQIPLRGLDLQAGYSQGAVLPTIIHHIRFSLLAAFAALCCFMLFTGYAAWRMAPRWVYLATALFLAATSMSLPCGAA